MKRPKLYRAKVLDIKHVSPKVDYLRINYTDPPELEFIPGQFVNLKCPEGKYRAYSIASSNSDIKNLNLLIEVAHEGIASNYVRTLKSGDEITIIGPSGMFNLGESLPSHLVFFATGTGIAPFVSMFDYLAESNYQGKVDLFFGIRNVKDLICEDIFLKMKRELSDFNYTIYFSNEENPQKGKFGRITKELNATLDKSARYFVCGHPAMVEEVKTALLKLGISEKEIRVEGFTRS